MLISTVRLAEASSGWERCEDWAVVITGVGANECERVEVYNSEMFRAKANDNLLAAPRQQVARRSKQGSVAPIAAIYSAGAISVVSPLPPDNSSGTGAP